MGIVRQQAEEKARVMVNEQYPEPILKVKHRRIDCPYCGRMICEGQIRTIRVKCPSCKQFSTIRQI